MLTKPILAILLATACAATPDTAPPERDTVDSPTDREPPDPPVQKIPQTFCCGSVAADQNSGEDCYAISHAPEVINACDQVLSCGNLWTKNGGDVVCSD
jgi:hypothetical protein